MWQAAGQILLSQAHFESLTIAKWSSSLTMSFWRVEAQPARSVPPAHLLSDGMAEHGSTKLDMEASDAPWHVRKSPERINRNAIPQQGAGGSTSSGLEDVTSKASHNALVASFTVLPITDASVASSNVNSFAAFATPSKPTGVLMRSQAADGFVHLAGKWPLGVKLYRISDHPAHSFHMNLLHEMGDTRPCSCS